MDKKASFILWLKESERLNNGSDMGYYTVVDKPVIGSYGDFTITKKIFRTVANKEYLIKTESFMFYLSELEELINAKNLKE